MTVVGDYQGAIAVVLGVAVLSFVIALTGVAATAHCDEALAPAADSGRGWRRLPRLSAGRA